MEEEHGHSKDLKKTGVIDHFEILSRGRLEVKHWESQTWSRQWPDGTPVWLLIIFLPKLKWNLDINQIDSKVFNMMGAKRQVRRYVSGAYLSEPEGGEGGGAVIVVHEAEDAE